MYTTISRERASPNKHRTLSEVEPIIVCVVPLVDIAITLEDLGSGVRTLQKGEKRTCLNKLGFIRHLLTAAQLPDQTDHLMLDVLFKLLVIKIHHSKLAQGLVPTAGLSARHVLFRFLLHFHSFHGWCQRCSDSAVG